MTSVSQRIPNFIGGVSQQADEKMLLGQVKEAVNCYPDITLGMLKRPGGKFIGKLASLTANTSDQTAWFSMFRDNQEKYIATITSAGVTKVWDLLTGLAGTVTYPSGKQASIESYLTATDYRSIKTLTINDFTYIVNSEKVVTAKAAPPSWNAKRQATIVIAGVENDATYTVKVGGSTFTYTSPAPPVAPATAPTATIAIVTAGLSGAITSGFATKTVIDNTIYLTFNSDTDVSGNAGIDGKSIRVFQDSVDTFARLPEQAKHNQVVKINNTNASQDDFYLKFIADDGNSGKGYWEETVAPNVSTGLNEATMPMSH
jgi:hypothetical protein